MKKNHCLRLQADRRHLRNNKRGYTLVELCLVLGILLVLSTIGIVFYQATLAHARGTVCQTNLKTLKKAVEEHAKENDAFPATLGQIKPKHIENAYVKAIGDIGWFAKFSLFLLKLEESGQAHAQFLSHDNLNRYGVPKKVFHCPADDNGTTNIYDSIWTVMNRLMHSEYAIY